MEIDYKKAFESACRELARTQKCENCNFYRDCHQTVEGCVEKMKEEILRGIKNGD